MKNAEKTSDLKNLLTLRMGQPAHTFPIRQKTQSAQWRELTFLVYPPGKGPSTVNTCIYSIGISDHRQPGPQPFVELELQLLGRWKTESLQELLVILADLIFTHLEAGGFFAPNLVLKDIPLPLFNKMPHLWLVDAFGDKPFFIANTGKPIRLLQLIPLSKSELPALQEAGSLNTFMSFQGAGLNLHYHGRTYLQNITCGDFSRFALILEHGKRREETLPEIWTAILNWYRVNAPELARWWRPALPEEQIPKDFPQPLRQLLSLSNGGTILRDKLRLLSTAEIQQNRSGLGEALWPFAVDPLGNLLALDDQGFVFRGGPHRQLEKISESLPEWFRQFRDGIYLHLLRKSKNTGEITDFVSEKEVLPLPIDKLLLEMRDWMMENAPHLQQAQVEDNQGFSEVLDGRLPGLHARLWEKLQDFPVGEFRLLGPSQIQYFRQLGEANNPGKRLTTDQELPWIKPGPWESEWIPLALGTGRANLLCLDFVPNGRGVSGQIIEVSADHGPSHTGCATLEEWLRKVHSGLFKGAYAVGRKRLEPVKPSW